MFKTMLFLDQIRGPHSTGVAAVDKKTDIHIYKRSLTAADFLQLGKAAVTITEGERVLIGHNRYATMGSKNDDNAHPFLHNGTVLAHNGTLTNKSQVNTDKELFDTDSETICYALSQEAPSDAKTVIERLEGAYALTWYDEYVNTINLARNDERPLWLGFTSDGVVWSSEKDILTLAAAHHKINIKDIQQLPVGEIWTWECGKMTEGHSVVEFTPKKPRIVTTSRQTGGYGKTSSTHGGGIVSSMVGKYVECFSPVVRASGYTEAISEDGQKVNITLLGPDKEKALRLNGDAVIRARVTSTHRQWQKGQASEVLNLSSLDVQVLDVDEWVAEDNAKKAGDEEAPAHNHPKCHICDGHILSPNSGEVHMGKTYHSDCLDHVEQQAKRYHN